jgi:hypothetical protein
MLEVRSGALLGALLHSSEQSSSNVETWSYEGPGFVDAAEAARMG